MLFPLVASALRLGADRQPRTLPENDALCHRRICCVVEELEHEEFGKGAHAATKWGTDQQVVFTLQQG